MDSPPQQPVHEQLPGGGVLDFVQIEVFERAVDDIGRLQNPVEVRRFESVQVLVVKIHVAERPAEPLQGQTAQHGLPAPPDASHDLRNGTVQLNPGGRSAINDVPLRHQSPQFVLLVGQDLDKISHHKISQRGKTIKILIVMQE